MPKVRTSPGTVAALLATALLVPTLAASQPSVLIVTDDCPPEADLEASGLFSAVDTFDHSAGTPTLVQLQAYDAVFAYSNDTPLDPIDLGDVLADYSDLGGCLSLATYAFSAEWAIAGRVMTTGYAPFLHTPTADLAEPDGGFVALLPEDPIFEGVDPSVLTYQSNDNMADGTLDTGAIALATDGLGLNMVARSGSRPVFGFNIYAIASVCGENNAETMRMIANSLANCRGIFADSFETHDYCAWSSAVPITCL